MLLDTCTFVWLVSEPDRLSEAARRVLDKNELHLSDVSILELALKWTAGKITLPQPPRVWVEQQTRIWSMTRLPLSREDIYRSTEIAFHHRDPFDRLLVGQSLEHQIPIVTPDAMIKRYPVAVVW